MSETPISATDLSPLRIAVFMTLAALGFAAIVGVIAVIDADHVISGRRQGIWRRCDRVVAGATIACGLACLVRGRVEVLALALALAVRARETLARFSTSGRWPPWSRPVSS